MLIFIIFLISVVAIFLGLHNELVNKDRLQGSWGLGTMVIGGLVLFMVLVVWIPSYLGSISEVQAFKGIEQTVINARKKDKDKMENAAISIQIAEQNAWLARTKYWDGTFWADWVITDDVRDLKPIE